MYCIAFIVFFLPCFSCFNIDTSNFVVYVDPQNGTTYFGYTVVLYPGNENGSGKWIKIGAPKGQDPRNHNKTIGVVYNCPLIEKCDTIAIKGYIDKDEILENYWIGGSMDINYRYQRMAICGFRSKYKHNNNNLLLGSCYLSNLNDSFIEKVPLKNFNRKTYKTREGQVFFYGQGEAGFSSHFPNDENALLLGAPGIYNWAGNVLKIADEFFVPPQANKLISGKSKRDIEQILYIPNVVYSKVNNVFDLFGYSISSGYFYEDRKLYYVASTPKSFDYKGKVVIFSFAGNDKPLIEKTSLVGTQLGEYFGASIASGDLNHDRFDDLIVGAPFHAENTYNEGAVYIFLGRREGQLKKHPPLHGTRTNGQFGSAIMFLGDINNDGFGDLAIGAPYEEEFSGVLYIFRGNQDGVELQPCQKIIGRHVQPEIKGFGISISRPADIDNNNYKDIAVGAHLSGNVVLLRTSPIVVVKYAMNSIPRELSPDTKNFILNICYWYTYFNGSSITLTRKLNVDRLFERAIPAAGKQLNNITIFKNRKGVPTCENITINLKNKINFESPITVSLSYNLTNQQRSKQVVYVSDKYKIGKDSFCSECPVLDEYRSIQGSSYEIPFSLGCGSDEICQSRLEVEAEFLGLGKGNVFVLGSLDNLNMDVTVRNSGENAYSTKLEVILPDTVYFRQIPSECNEQTSSAISCNVDNPLKTNDKKELSFNLDMKKVTRNIYKTEIAIILNVRTASNNSNPSQKVLMLSLKREADVEISGKAGQQSIPFEVRRGMPNFTHTYWIEKIGASPLEKVSVSISIPHTIETSKGNVTFVKAYSPVGTFADQPLICTSHFDYIAEPQSTVFGEGLELDVPLIRKARQVEVSKEMTNERNEKIVIEGKNYDLAPNRTFFINCSVENVVCSSIECDIGPFERKQTPAVIQIKLMFDPTAISSLIGNKDIILYSTHGSTEIHPQFQQSGNRNDAIDVSVLFVANGKDKIALWIVVLSAIAGFLLLILIIYGLTKVGFFKREKKEELKNMKAAHTQQMIEQEAMAEPSDPTACASTEDLVDDQQEET